MPVTWNIRGGVITLTIITRANSDLRKMIIEAMSHPEFPKFPAVLIDTRRATENPTPDVLRLRAGWIATLLSRRAGSRCALVAGPKPHQYGLARMLSVFIQTEGVHAEVFTTLREARRWLMPADGRQSGGATGRA